jgi:hypothetical protein
MTPSLDEWAPWAARINAGRMVGGLERVRRKLAGVADGDRQMVSILTTVLSDGLPAGGNNVSLRLPATCPGPGVSPHPAAHVHRLRGSRRRDPHRL